MKEKKGYPEDKFKTIEYVTDKALLLFQMIKSRGSNLSLNLCKKFLEEMKKSLARDLTIDDLKNAVNSFIKQG